MVQSYWGQRDLTEVPVEEDVLTFIKNLRDFYMQNRDVMCFGNMVKPLPYETGTVTYCNTLYGRSYTTEEVLSTAFELDGKRVQIFVNFNKDEKTVQCAGKQFTVGGLSVIKYDLV